MFGVGAGDVSQNDFLTRRIALQVIGIEFTGWAGLRVAEQLPHDVANVIRNSPANKILEDEFIKLSIHIFSYNKKIQENCILYRIRHTLKNFIFSHNQGCEE